MTTSAGATTAGATAVGDEPDPADRVAAAVLAVDGVAELHGGMFGEAATYLPGRKVAGIRLSEQGAEVHVVVDYGRAAPRVADAVRRAVAPLVTGTVDVIVEDIRTDDDSADDPTEHVTTASSTTTGSAT